MSSVASKILSRLFGRLGAIDGTGLFNFDMRDQIFRCQPQHNIASGGKRAIFIARRNGGDTRANKIGPGEIAYDVTTTYDVFAIAGEEDDVEPGEQLEMLLEDIERALEVPTDKLLRDEATGRNLLSEPLQLVDAIGSMPETWGVIESVAVGVRCVHPHVYGKPEEITK